MQDLGGCRAIGSDVAMVYALRDRLKQSLSLRDREDDYIKKARPGGYRSLHLVHEEAKAGTG
jgi:ppGpp synthetase/RelA/SpoT-type nucleotidyltranferase